MQLLLSRIALPQRVLRCIAPTLLVCSVVALVEPAFAHAIEVWSTREEFSFGFLVLPVAVAIVWLERIKLRRSIGQGSSLGLLMVIVSAVLVVLARRVGVHAAAGLAISPLLWGIAIALWGWRTGLVLAFPIWFLAFGLALHYGILSSLGFALQGVTANASEHLGRVLGLAIVREGLVLKGDSFAFIVAEACSGMSSLVSLLALASIWVYLGRGRPLSRLGLLLSVTPVVMMANVVRVTLVLVVASWFGQEAALGFFHSASSLVLFGAAVCGLLLVSRVVGCKPPAFAI